MGAKRWSVGLLGPGLVALLVVCWADAAQAAPFLTVSLVGSVHGSGDPFTSQVFVHAGDTVDYQVLMQLAPQGTTNPFGSRPTITRWVPSNGAQSPTDGLNSLGFSLDQSAAAGTIQTDFASVVAGTTTGGGTWGVSVGSKNGTLVDRGNGNHDLLNVLLIRESGNLDGIADDLSQEILPVATGAFSIAAGGTGTVLNVNYQGFTKGNLVAVGRWRDATNTSNELFATSVQAYNDSVTGSDPLTVFHALTVSPAGITPEPVSLGVLGVAGSALVARRRRRGSAAR